MCVGRCILHVFFLFSMKRFTIHSKAETNSKTENESCFRQGTNLHWRIFFLERTSTYYLHFKVSIIKSRFTVMCDRREVVNLFCHFTVILLSGILLVVWWTTGSLALKMNLASVLLYLAESQLTVWLCMLQSHPGTYISSKISLHWQPYMSMVEPMSNMVTHWCLFGPHI